MSFSYEILIANEIITLHLEGKLMSKEEAETLIEHVEELSNDVESMKVNLDLSNLEYMNSSGLSVLISILTKVRNTGGEAIISNVSNKIKELLIITKLNTVFTIVGSNEKAAEFFNKNTSVNKNQ